MDGEELMVPRVPRLPPEPSARQIAEHELTGHGVYRSWGHHCVASRGRAPLTLHERKESCQTLASTMASLVVTEKMCCRSCLSNAETVQPDAWQQQLLTGKARQTTFITSLGFKRILVRSDNERSLLSLASRVSNCLPGVQLVLMTSLDGDHAANGLAEVGVEESARTVTRQSDR